MFMEQINAWVKQPFSEQMDLLHWGLFILFIVAMVILWNDALKFITGEAK